MPKATFDRISHEKKERLFKEAACLFAQRGFSQADVGELASRAQIAKGSLYNYFDNKDELYLYVCREALSRSRTAVYGKINPEWDIYQQIEHIFRSGIDFVESNPEFVTLYLNVSSAGMERFALQISREIEEKTAKWLQKLIRRGIENNQVRPNIDVEMTAFLINSIYIMTIASTSSRHYQIRFQEYLNLSDEPDIAVVKENVSRVVNLIATMLRPSDQAEER